MDAVIDFTGNLLAFCSGLFKKRLHSAASAQQAFLCFFLKFLSFVAGCFGSALQKFISLLKGQLSTFSRTTSFKLSINKPQKIFFGNEKKSITCCEPS